MLETKKVLFIGAGSMAEAIAAGMVNQDKLPPSNIMMTNKQNEERRIELMKKYKVIALPYSEVRVQEADLIILAMKPKDAEKALIELKPKLKPDQIVLSVLAGISTGFMEEILPDEQPVIRVMPNTSSTIGESITAVTGGQSVTMEHIEIAKELFSAVGRVKVIEEEQMDVFTGIAGSGPAYIYYVLEHIEKTAQAEGLDEDLAREIAAQTVFGASKMVLDTNASPESLRKKVTSPNGTTAAGLNALQENEAGQAFTKAIINAKERSAEIRKELEKVTV
ncbi:pyrroline-5-carboxylate reductase [Fictibacillus sp. KIGAM418]|uniref:Pyrroline-5-carboxylate reductase n=1 Tax=Fictibacillus marinisediminis TaxID=2878389 RepID=A0A9X2BD35_9BACL|nr:pyrroline-5-carboxylate reductase [Fictibacillus marinisediminis]MCK6257216.1 pyrroline-5-carboxylate reductase [Fictibacillus marinisediminis]